MKTCKHCGKRLNFLGSLFRDKMCIDCEEAENKAKEMIRWDKWTKEQDDLEKRAKKIKKKLEERK